VYRASAFRLLAVTHSSTVRGGVLGGPPHQRVDESASDTAATNLRRRPHRDHFDHVVSWNRVVSGPPADGLVGT